MLDYLKIRSTTSPRKVIYDWVYPLVSSTVVLYVCNKFGFEKMFYLYDYLSIVVFIIATISLINIYFLSNVDINKTIMGATLKNFLVSRKLFLNKAMFFMIFESLIVMLLYTLFSQSIHVFALCNFIFIQMMWIMMFVFSHMTQQLKENDRSSI